MGSNGIDLLRMLEPAIRPDGVAHAGAGAPRPPIETTDFQTLLAQAQSQVPAAGDPDEAATASPAVPQAQQTRWLADLAGVERIENASLRSMLTRGATAVDDHGRDTTHESH